MLSSELKEAEYLIKARNRLMSEESSRWYWGPYWIQTESLIVWDLIFKQWYDHGNGD